MRSFIQKGESLQLTAPVGGVVGGAGVLIGTALFNVPQQTAAAGALYDGLVEGVIDHAKAAVAIAAGDIAYWDNAAKLVTNVVGSNLKIGVFVAAAIAGAPLGRVRLSGQY